MGKYSEQMEIKKEAKEREKTRKEKLAEYFFSLSNTTFGSLVIGVTLLMLQADANYNVNVIFIMLAAGLLFFIVLAKIGNNILK